jgi:hypothetical protein
MLMSALTTIKDAMLFMALAIVVLVIDAIIYIHCGLLRLTKNEPFKPCVKDIEDMDPIDDYDYYVYNE